jgi:hypothetical protein
MYGMYIVHEIKNEILILIKLSNIFLVDILGSVICRHDHT